MKVFIDIEYDTETQDFQFGLHPDDTTMVDVATILRIVAIFMLGGTKFKVRPFGEVVEVSDKERLDS